MSAAVYYLVLPFLAAWLVLRFLKKYAPHDIPEDIARLCAEKPIEKKFFRAVRRDHKGLRHLGDFETQPEAVECVYRAKEGAGKAEKAAFLVLNDKGEVLEEVDAGA
jgi:hypothetical protein